MSTLLFFLFAQLAAARVVPPVLAFPEPGLDDPAAYKGYATRLYRDAAGNAVQIYLNQRDGRVVLVWGNGANESVAFSARDSLGRPASLGWESDSARVGSTGSERWLEFRLRAASPVVELGGFLLGSMRWERDFQYRRDHLKPFDPPPAPIPELAGLVDVLEQLPAAERQAHLRLLRARSAAELAARLEPRVALARQGRRWTARLEQASLDGRNRLVLEVSGNRDAADAVLDGRTVRVRSRSGVAVLRIRATTDAPPLTPLSRHEIFRPEFLSYYTALRAQHDSARARGRDGTAVLRFRQLERQVRGVELLSSREKMMAALPNYATYFGRDMMVSALLMQPVWRGEMLEHVIASALRKLNPAGEVSHEEALGGQAILENAVEYRRTVDAALAARQSGDTAEADKGFARARELLARLQHPRENYWMIDDDLQLAVVVGRYLADARIEASHQREFLLAPGGPGGESRLHLLLRNFALVADWLEPYAADGVPTSLVSFRRLPDGRWHAGSWRDSGVGYGGGRFAYDVNVVWAPAALAGIRGALDAFTRLGLGPDTLLAHAPEMRGRRLEHWLRDPAVLERALERWRATDRHFRVSLARADLKARVDARVAFAPADERAYWVGVLDGVALPDTLSFPALSLDSAGRPIPVLSTDPALRLLLEDWSDAVLTGRRSLAELRAELRPLLLPYPVGLFVDGLGPLVANDAYAARAVWENFQRDSYHSPRVVWGREVNILIMALAEESAAAGRACATGNAAGCSLQDELSSSLRRVQQAVDASGLEHNELWSYRMEGGRLLPARYGTSSDVQLWNLTDLAVEFALARTHRAEGAPYEPSRDLGLLFHDVQLAGLFPDSKTFVDARPVLPPAEIAARYAAARSSAGFSLSAFVEQYFEVPGPVGEGFRSDTSRPMEEHIRALWPVLTRARDTVDARSSLIPLPNAYVVPGGRFREVYYWDSYFTMLGLVESGRTDLVRSMLDNFAHLIRTVGHIPNGNRTYYLSRSQPPYFAAMIGLYAAATDTTQALRYLDALEAEHAFWMAGAERLAPGTAQRRVVKLRDGAVLNRYWDDRPEPRPESYRPDYELGRTLPESRREAFYRNVRAAAESGWDFSSRWMRDASDLRTLETTDLVAVDLNSLLYHAERTIAALRAFRGRAGDAEVAERFARAAEQRRRALVARAYDPESGFFYDIRWRTGERVTDRPTLAAAAPLYFGLATPEQGRAVAARLEREFLKAGGFVTTLIDTDQQWDAPNGWPPLQWLAIEGVRRYGRADLAAEARERWLELNRRTYRGTGKMTEKYDVVDLTRRAGGGEYPTQDGFGWTNGVALALAAQKRHTPVPCESALHC